MQMDFHGHPEMWKTWVPANVAAKVRAGLAGRLRNIWVGKVGGVVKTKIGRAAAVI
ncbi:hypothetical protein [Paraburkholderia caribensis]|uniref:hypothetical protein n=2 Tax=Paraburkholderia caribensis TaxID=75105 RepID=UPI000B2838E6|nr:hypothetical protein [Paraburkholderia caribensis]